MPDQPTHQPQANSGNGTPKKGAGKRRKWLIYGGIAILVVLLVVLFRHRSANEPATASLQPAPVAPSSGESGVTGAGAGTGAPTPGPASETNTTNTTTTTAEERAEVKSAIAEGVREGVEQADTAKGSRETAGAQSKNTPKKSSLSKRQQQQIKLAEQVEKGRAHKRAELERRGRQAEAAEERAKAAKHRRDLERHGAARERAREKHAHHTKAPAHHAKPAAHHAKPPAKHRGKRR